MGVKLVKMYKEGKTADVHPEEVINFKKANWSTKKPKNEDKNS